MGLTISHRSALDLLRAARIEAGEEGLSLASTDILPPVPDEGERWASLTISKVKHDLDLPERRPLDVLVPTAESRMRVPGVTNHVLRMTARGHWFLELGTSGIVVPCPELLLAQMAEVVDLPELIAIGHELCGAYTLPPGSSSRSAFTGTPAVTSEEKIRDLLKQAKGLRGRAMLRAAIPRIRDGSASAQETCLSTMAQLATGQFGYQLGKVDLNRSVGPPLGCENLTKASHRVPDLLIRGTRVGINYDGTVHGGLPTVVKAAMALGAEPDDAALRQALEEAVSAAWDAIASDKERDRDLMAMGYVILPVTKSDLESIDGLDLVMRQVISPIEDTTGRDMSLQRRALDDEELKEGRRLLLGRLRNL